MIYTLNFGTQFKRDFKLIKKRGYDIAKIEAVFELLANDETFPMQYKKHKLRGKYLDCEECHIQPDWLLIWKTKRETNEIDLVRTGTHSDLF
jgi:mRNA interferase YafQ